MVGGSNTTGGIVVGLGEHLSPSFLLYPHTVTGTVTGTGTVTFIATATDTVTATYTITLAAVPPLFS